MRYRELLMRKLEMVEGNIALIRSQASNPSFTSDNLFSVLNKQKEIIQEIKDYINKEEYTPYELGKR